MSFLFVDQILQNEPGRYIKGQKLIRADETYLFQRNDGAYALLPAILGETLGQLGAWNVMHAGDFRFRPVAGVVAATQSYADALVGQNIILETTISHWDEQAVEYNSRASVDGRVIYEIEHAIGPMLAMADFSDAQVVATQFETLFKPTATPIIASDSQPCPYTQFDQVIEHQFAERVRAVKYVDAHAPYFPDHFPNNPVLPLTILLSCKMDIVLSLAREIDAKWTRVDDIRCRLSRIKMNQFVKPGQEVHSSIELKQKTEQRLHFQLRSEVDGKRVCLAQAELHYDYHEDAK